MRTIRHALLVIALIVPFFSAFSASPIAAAPRQAPSLATPTNDDFGAPLAIDTFPASISLDTSGATLAPDDPVSGCGSGTNNASVWYRLVIPGKGRISLDTAGSNYDTVLAVYTGARGMLSVISCNDDIAGARTSQVSFTAPNGSTTFWVEVSAYSSGSGGSLSLNANFQAALSLPLDIMLLQDETGSMGDDITALQQLVPAIWDGVDSLTSVQFRMGVAGFRDYARDIWGESNDWVYRPLGNPTSARADFTQMLSYLTANQGYDGPEGSYPAIQYMLTADHPCIDSNNNGSCADSYDTAAGLQPTFRSGARRVLLLATDAPSHTPVDAAGYPGPTQEELIFLLQQTRTVVIGLVPGGAGTIPAIDALAAATGGSVQNTGASGSAVAEAIVAAISDLKPVSPTLSTLTLSASTAPADGTTTVDVHVTLRDTAGRPVSGRTVWITSPRGVEDIITQPATPTDINGETVGTISSATAGDVQVGAINISDNVTLAQTGALSFTVVNAQLRNYITSSNQTTRTYLNGIGQALTDAGDEGDYFVGAVAMDALSLATDIFFKTTSVLSVKQTTDVASRATYMAYPGTVKEEGWSAILRLKEAFPASGAFFDDAVQHGVQSSDWSGMTLTVLKGGMKHYAAVLFRDVYEELGESAAEELLKQLISAVAGMPKVAAKGVEAINGLQSAAEAERDSILADLPALSIAQEQAYIEDLRQRNLATIMVGSAYTRQEILLHSLQGAHETVGNDGITGVILRFVASSTAGAAFDGPGKAIVDGLVGSFDTYINIRKLTESGRGAILALSLLKGGPEAAVRIYGNTVGAYERIRRQLPPTPLNARITAIKSYSQGSGVGWIWFEENSFSDVTIANDSDTSATFEVFADYGYTSNIFLGLFSYAFMPMVETEVAEIPAHESRTVRIYYRQGARGGSPAEQSDVNFSVLASVQNDNSLRLAAHQMISWKDILHLNMDGTLASALAAAAPQEVVENPISSYVLVDEETQTYEAQLWMGNPFSALISADISQQLPAGTTVVATDGVQNGDTIRWQRDIDASNLVSATVTFRIASAPGTPLQLPAATMSFVEPVSGLSISIKSNSPTFQALWPLAADWSIPAGSTGQPATLSMKLTNYLAEPLSGEIVIQLAGVVQKEVIVPFSLSATGVGTVPVTLPAVAYPGLYDLKAEIRPAGASPLTRRGVYAVSGKALAPPPNNIYLPLTRR